MTPAMAIFRDGSRWPWWTCRVFSGFFEIVGSGWLIRNNQPENNSYSVDSLLTLTQTLAAPVCKLIWRPTLLWRPSLLWRSTLSCNLVCPMTLYALATHSTLTNSGFFFPELFFYSFQMFFILFACLCWCWNSLFQNCPLRSVLLISEF